MRKAVQGATLYPLAIIALLVIKVAYQSIESRIVSCRGTGAICSEVVWFRSFPDCMHLCCRQFTSAVGVSSPFTRVQRNIYRRGIIKL